MESSSVESNSTHLSSQTSYGLSEILSMFILSLTFFLGLPGNGLVLWVAGLKMKRTVNTVWFLHLTLADFLCCLSLPFSLIHMVLRGHWPYGFFLCKLIPSIIILNMFASVFLLTAISLDRCLMVYRPIWCQNHRKVRWAFLICVCIWALAFAMCIPVFIYRKTFVQDTHTKCGYDFSSLDYDEYNPDLPENNSLLEFAQFPTDNLEPSSFQANDRTWIAATVLLGSQTSQGSSGDAEVASQHSVQPTGMPTPATPTRFPSGDHRTNIPENSTNFQFVPSPSSNYTELMNTFQDDYWEQLMLENQKSTPVVAMTISRSVLGFLVPFIIMVTCYGLIVFRMTKSNLNRSSNKTFRVTVVVVMVFLVCWTPYHIIGILLMYIDSSTPLGQALVPWDHLSIALASANSCFNPFLYAFLGKDFRKKAKQSMKGILEAAFNEDLTPSTNCTQDRGTSKLNEMSTGV